MRVVNENASEHFTISKKPGLNCFAVALEYRSRSCSIAVALESFWVSLCMKSSEANPTSFPCEN